MDTTGPPHWSQSVPDGPQLGDKVGSIIRRTWLRVLNNTVKIGTAVLTDVFIGIAVIAVEVRRKFGEKGDDIAAVLPSPKHDNISLSHLASP
jgi:hypothetical protein